MPLIYRSRDNTDPSRYNPFSVVAIDEAIDVLLADNIIEPVDESDKEGSDKVLKEYVIRPGELLDQGDKTAWQRLVELVTALNTEFDDEDEDEIPQYEEGEAKYVCEVVVVDPDSKGTVVLAVFKDQRTNGMFALDTSWIEQSTTLEDSDDTVPSPFEGEVRLKLTGID